MRVAYVTTYDPENVLNWSGTGAFIYKCLKEQGFEVEPLGPLPPYGHIRRHWLRAKHLWYNRVWRRHLGGFSAERDHGVARFLANAVMEKLTARHYDLIFSPGTIPVAFVDSDLPIVTWADATFHSRVRSYPEYAHVTRDYYRDGESLERIALERASLCIYSSDWAAKSAIEDYGIERAKVKVVPFGANVDDNVSEDDVRTAISRRGSDKVRLLFVGVDFVRKGGPKVFEVLAGLLQIGVPAELHILGCTPDVPVSLRGHTHVRGFVSKRKPDGRQLIADAYMSSHWLILLPSAECYGVVFAEANRYGVPCVATQVGGIPTIIKDDRNGRLFPVNAPSMEIANYIANIFRDRDRYISLATASYGEYRARLNWRVAGERLADCIQTATLRLEGVAGL